MGTRSPDPRSVKWVAILGAALAAMAAPAGSEAGGNERGKATDLAIRAVEVDPPRFFFADEPSAQIMVTVRVENGGRAPTPRSAGVVRLSQRSEPTAGAAVATELRIPAMKPGRVRTPRVFIEAGRLPGLGTYAVEACVGRRNRSVARRPKLACRPGKDVAVIPRVWGGEVRGSAERIRGVTESWIVEVGFFYEPAEGGSITPFGADGFTYTPFGRIDFTTSGTDEAGCVHDGEGSFPIEPGDGKLFLSRDLTSYRGTGSIVVPDELRYPISVRCGTFGGRRRGPDTSAWLETAEQGISPVATRLENAHTDPESGIAWDWGLDSF